MNKRIQAALISACLLLLGGPTLAADVVPTDAQMPGTQPGELSKAPDSGRCANCHGGYDASAEPYHTWRGSMMSHAGRDPIFWATVAIAEQDFDGAGDICLRCHMPATWLGGRSVPTDGSGTTASQGDGSWGVQCDFCHRLVNPDGSEHPGVQTPPFVASTDGEGHYGSGQYVLSNNSNDKLGPYADAEARHGSLKSDFHRSSDLCGTCHDVSNPVVGNLAHNNGAQDTADPVIDDNTLGGPVDGKAAFNNPPYKYGIVERTFSEHIASGFDTLLVDDIDTLPAELQSGSILRAWQAATQNGSKNSANYEDGDARFFTCQTCHMAPENLDPIAVEATQGCDKNPPFRTDMPVHDLTGGNYWMPTAIQYMDDVGTLLRGGGIGAEERAMMDDGILRALGNLQQSASLSVNANTLRVVNLTGHKLISGYPEGRRMWLNIKWYNDAGALLREDGAYGDIQLQYDANGDGAVNASDKVRSLLNLADPNTKVYEAHAAITQEWANQLVGVSAAYAGVPVAFDRVSGTVLASIGDVANQAAGSYHETFHFVLNNKVVKDNRIPPWGMSYDEARVRNSLPVPASQYGNPGTGGTYEYWDSVQLNPPGGAVYAEIDLVYQPTSWEYIQFLTLANNGSKPFLADEGRNLQAAWMATGMAEPEVMASTTWGTPPGGGNTPPVANNDAYSTTQNTPLSVAAPGVLGNDTDADGDPLSVADPRTAAPTSQGGTVTLNSDGSFSYTPPAGFTGDDSFGYSATDGTDASNAATVTITVNAATGNTAPVANNDAYTTDQDVVLTQPAPGVLGNDTDANGDTLTVADPRTNAATSQGGTVTLNSDGSFSYTPPAGFTGDDSFGYSASDGTDTSNAATVTVSVAGVVDCSSFTNKNSCNAEASCRWDNRNRLCIAK